MKLINIIVIIKTWLTKEPVYLNNSLTHTAVNIISKMMLRGRGTGFPNSMSHCARQWKQVCNIDFFCVVVALRPKSTAMVMAGRSVHQSTLFPGQA